MAAFPTRARDAKRVAARFPGALGPDLADRLRVLGARRNLRRANEISGVVRHGMG